MNTDSDNIYMLTRWIDDRTEYVRNTGTDEDFKEWQKRAEIVLAVIDEYFESEHGDQSGD